jgi:hypothetical protein
MTKASNTPPIDRTPADVGESGYARIDGDPYFTPAWVTKALLREESFRPKIWEPAAGAWLMADVLIEAGHEVSCSDITDYGRGNAILDFLSCALPDPSEFDLVCNPPFKLSNAFVARALHWAKAGGGKIAFLLPIAWSAAKTRGPFFRTCPEFETKYELLDRIKWLTAVAHDGQWEVIPLAALNPDPNKKEASPHKDHAWYVWNCRATDPGGRLDWLRQKEETQGRLL